MHFCRHLLISWYPCARGAPMGFHAAPFRAAGCRRRAGTRRPAESSIRPRMDKGGAGVQHSCQAPAGEPAGSASRAAEGRPTQVGRCAIGGVKPRTHAAGGGTRAGGGVQPRSGRVPPRERWVPRGVADTAGATRSRKASSGGEAGRPAMPEVAARPGESGFGRHLNAAGTTCRNRLMTCTNTAQKPLLFVRVIRGSCSHNQRHGETYERRHESENKD